MSLQDAKAVRVKEEPDWEDKISAQGVHVESEEEPESEAGAAAGRMVKEELGWTDEEACGVRTTGVESKKEEDGQPGYLDSEVKAEGEWESSSGVSEAAALAGLYVGHAVKEEVVVGPVEIHRPKQLIASREPSEEEEQDEQLVAKSMINKKSTILQSTLADEASSLSYEKNHKPYKCAHCSFATAHSISLKVHASTHTGEKPHKCTQCSYASASKSHLNQHQKSHSEEKPYKCSLCSFSTAYSLSIKVHAKLHTGEKPYKCAHCSYATAYKCNLVQHKKTHVNKKVKKSYKCDHCRFESASKSILECHIETHTRTRLLKCAHCSYTSALKGKLLTHEKMHARGRGLRSKSGK